MVDWLPKILGDITRLEGRDGSHGYDNAHQRLRMARTNPERRQPGPHPHRDAESGCRICLA